MIIRNARKTLVISSIALWFILKVSSALAGIGVQPTITEIVAEPGETKSGSFAVSNAGDEPVLVKIELEDWLKLRLGKSPVDIEDYLTVDETEFELGALEAKDVHYSIVCPEGVEGELITMAFFSSAVPGGGSLNITSRFGVAVYVGIKGTEIIDAGIKDIRGDKSTLAVVIENKGNVHIRPRGKVFIRDAKGKLIREAEISYTAVIFAGKEHTYPLDLNGAEIAPGNYEIEAVFTTGTIYEKEKEFRKTVNLQLK